MNSGGCLATREGKLHCQRSLSLTGNLLKARRDCLAAYVEICNRGTYPPACMRKVVAEFIGTFALVFAGTGAIVINDVSNGAITHVGIALTFGLIVVAMIYTLGDISGAHLNPAVTIGFWVSRRLRGHEVLPFTASQCAGALAAS